MTTRADGCSGSSAGAPVGGDLRRAQTVLLPAQGMPVAKTAEETFTSADRVRDVIHNFNADGFGSLCPKYAGERARTFTLPERRECGRLWTLIGGRPSRVIRQTVRHFIGLRGPHGVRTPSMKPPHHAFAPSRDRIRTMARRTHTPR